MFSSGVWICVNQKSHKNTLFKEKVSPQKSACWYRLNRKTLIFDFKTKTRKHAQQIQAANGSPIFGRKYVRIKFFITPWRFQVKSMKTVIFDRKNLVPNLCCTQAVFSISVKPWKLTSGEPGGRRCRISTPTACKNFCRLFLKRKRGLARFCAKFDTQCCRWLKNKHFSTRPWFVIYLWQCTLGATTAQV